MDRAALSMDGLPAPKTKEAALLRTIMSHDGVTLSHADPQDMPAHILVWGDDGSGQCMGGARSTLESCRTVPTEVQMPPEKRDVVQVGTGWEQSFLVLGKGGIWCGGANRGKCLSEEGQDDQFLGPQPLDRSEADDFQAGAIAAGRDHFVAVQRDGVRLLTWAASNEFGQTGQGDARVDLGPCCPRQFAIQSASLGSVRVCAVSCGENHTLVLTEHGEAFAWGSNSVGQLGLPDLPAGGACSSPRCIDAGALRGLPIRQVAAGSQHSLALGISGEVVSWGSNRHGRCGLGEDFEDRDKFLVPTRVVQEELTGNSVRLIAAGGAHSAAVLRKGVLFLAGDNRSGQLGHSPQEISSVSLFLKLPFQEYGLQVRTVSLGESHTLLLSYKGALFGMGANDRGQLGEPLDGCVHEPRQVHLPDPQFYIWAVSAGPGHSVVLASRPPESHMLKVNDSPRPKAPRTESLLVLSPPASPTPEADDHEPLVRTGEGVGFRGFAQEETPPRLRSSGCASKIAESPRLHIPFSPKAPSQLGAGAPALDAIPEEFVLLRPIVRPGVAANVPFACLTIASLQELVKSIGEDAVKNTKDYRLALAATLGCPLMLGSSFILNGLYGTRLDAAGLVQQLAKARQKLALEDELALVGASRQGLKLLVQSETSPGVLHGMETRDQVRVLVLYLMIPNWAKLLEAKPAEMLIVAEDLLHAIARLPLRGRVAFRDLVADECGSVAVFRDSLLVNAQALANASVRRIVEQQRDPRGGNQIVWYCTFLLQLFWMAESERLEKAKQTAMIARTNSVDVDFIRGNSGQRLSRANSFTSGQSIVQGTLAAGAALPLSCFHIDAVVEADFPPQLELEVFHQNARLKVMDPAEILSNPKLEVDDKGELPAPLRSFMANGNLMPTSFKQRVLQVENHIRQVQEQARQGPMLPWGVVMANPFVLQVRRENLVDDTVVALRSTSPQDLRRPLKVKFANEEGIDEGGVAREYFRLLSNQFFSPHYGMFRTDPESRYLWFHPGSEIAEIGPEQFEIAGVVLALAVYNNLPGLDVNFPPALFKKLKGLPVTLADLQVVFPAVANSLQALMAWEPPAGLSDAQANKEFENIFCMDFSLTYDDGYGSSKVVSLLQPDATKNEGEAEYDTVTLARRAEFVELYKDWWLTTGIKKQFESFQKGFGHVCGGSAVFDGLSAQELEAIVCGERDLDFAHLRKGARVVDSEVAFRAGYLDDFWDVISGFDKMQKKQFLNFVSGSDLAPVGGLQLLDFKIQRNGGEPTDRLPTSHTCFNLLMLPEYSNKDKLARCMMTAMENAEGFGLQ